MYQRITVISGNLVEKNHVSVSKYRSNKIFIYSGALAVVVVVERCRHVLLFVLILAIRKGLNHGAEARRRLGIPRSTIYEQRYTLFLFRPVRGSVGSVVVASCGLRYEATFPPSPLPLCICGVVCHSQVLAKYARPFVSDLLFWHRRCSTLAANRIKCFCRVLSLSLRRTHLYMLCTRIRILYVSSERIATVGVILYGDRHGRENLVRSHVFLRNESVARFGSSQKFFYYLRAAPRSFIRGSPVDTTGNCTDRDLACETLSFSPESYFRYCLG